MDGRGRGLIQEMERPEPGPGEIMVAVMASMISPGTELGAAGRMRGEPDEDYGIRPFGYTNAGIVAAVGDGVASFAAGDRVACMGWGAALHADFAVVPQNLCVPIPDELSFAEASSVHLAATALNAIRKFR